MVGWWVAHIYLLSKHMVWRTETTPFAFVGQASGHLRASRRGCVQAHRTQEIKIAAFIGLQDVLCKQPAIATSVVGPRLRHSGQATCDLARFDEEIEPAVRYVQFDEVASAHGRERTTSRRLWCSVHDNGAERGATHAGIADPYHVTDA